MMRICAFIFGLFVSLFCVELHAQEQKPPDPYPFGKSRLALPQGVESSATGVSMQCFNNIEYRTLILIGGYYSKLYDWRLVTLGEMQGLRDTVASRDHSIALQFKLIKELKDDREWLTLRLNQTVENVTRQASSARYERYAFWAVIVIETGYILIQGIRQ